MAGILDHLRQVGKNRKGRPVMIDAPADDLAIDLQVRHNSVPTVLQHQHPPAPVAEEEDWPWA